MAPVVLWKESMEKKIACLISCSDHYNHRLNVPAQYLCSRGYEVTYITSDFDHVSKERYCCNVPGCVQLQARPYRKNLSFARVWSHRQFARDVFRYLEKMPQEPDLLVMLLPPNFLAKYAAAYKKKHPHVRLIFDIFDLWPETFPSSVARKLMVPVFRIWSGLRDNHLYAADHIITECELFRQRLGLKESDASVVHLGADALTGDIPAQLSDSRWDLCYLGSINNIIDIPRIGSLLKELAKSRSVTLHIIGTGERLEELMTSARTNGAEVIYHGAVYDDLEKLNIMSRCHFGLNILKESVCIGLTMKSVEYWRMGLPIINNVPADTAQLVQEYNCGIALDEACANGLQGLDMNWCMQMRKNARNLFNACFARNVIDRQYAQLLDDVIRECYE